MEVIDSNHLYTPFLLQGHSVISLLVKCLWIIKNNAIRLV